MHSLHALCERDRRVPSLLGRLLPETSLDYYYCHRHDMDRWNRRELAQLEEALFHELSAIERKRLEKGRVYRLERARPERPVSAS